MATWLIGYKLENDTLPRPLKVTGGDANDAVKSAMENLAVLGWDPGSFMITAVMEWKRKAKLEVITVQ